jgi:hypothetical protein
MRTTVTIDPDTEALLKEEMRRTGLSFKEVLNAGIRRAIGTTRPDRHRVKVKPLFSAPFPVEFQDLSFNRLADQLDDVETLRELGE